MSLGDLNNPKAAAEQIKAFRKRYSTKVCMAPQEDHEGRIVAAHTLSAQAVLSKLSRNSHVYAVASNFNVDSNGHPIEIQRLGIR